MGIGSLSKVTGIPASTIRTWERRYGFPVPERTQSGRRVYHSDVVAHLQAVALALSAGHRASEILSLALHDLEGLLKPAPTDSRTRFVPESWKGAVRALDAPELSRLFSQEASQVGMLDLLEYRMGPFLFWLGQAWSDGKIAIYHEHFASNQVRHYLEVQWRTLAPPGRVHVVCATLPGELHDLGVHLCAVAVAAGHRRPIVLPGSTPVEVIAAAARDARAEQVAISLSAHSRGMLIEAQLMKLRRTLPRDVALFVGGAGAPKELDGAQIGLSLNELSFN
jgi:methanogenic corrinoid protein MtbC1